MRRLRVYLSGPITKGDRVANFAQACNFSQRCGANVPEKLHRRFAGLDADPAAHQRAAVDTAAEMIHALIQGGIDALHIYTLNRAELTRAICAAAGIGEAAPAPIRAVGD